MEEVLPDAPAEALRETYRLEDQVGFLLRLAGQRHAAIFQEMSPLGLTPTQFSALVRLAQLGDCSQNELGRRTAMDVATIKGVVGRLRGKGMVLVAPDSADRRRSVLSIAPEYRSRVDELFNAGHAISRETLKPLTEGEREALLRLLGKIGASQSEA